MLIYSRRVVGRGMLLMNMSLLHGLKLVEFLVKHLREQYYKRYYYNKKERDCLSFIYSGCGGTKNNFQTRADCKKACK
uniref:SFRICE_029634 n=1 Tax=Spodoptera frugiperda TaxID=7108 RepID=A0A2H1VZV7_SPOFR